MESVLYTFHKFCTGRNTGSFGSDPTESLLRVLIELTGTNGFASPSRVMIDKITAARRDRPGRSIGTLSDVELLAVNRSVLVFLGIA